MGTQTFDEQYKSIQAGHSKAKKKTIITDGLILSLAVGIAITLVIGFNSNTSTMTQVLAHICTILCVIACQLRVLTLSLVRYGLLD